MARRNRVRRKRPLAGLGSSDDVHARNVTRLDKSARNSLKYVEESLNERDCHLALDELLTAQGRYYSLLSNAQSIVDEPVFAADSMTRAGLVGRRVEHAVKEFRRACVLEKGSPVDPAIKSKFLSPRKRR